MATVTITLVDEGNLVNTNVDFGIEEGTPDDANASPAQILGNMLVNYLDNIAAAAKDFQEAEHAPADAA